jgi:hypothetical protein
MAAPSTPPSYAVGQRLKASALNLGMTVLSELQPPAGWATSSAGTNPVVTYASRVHGWLADVRIKLVYTSAPGTLTLTVAAVPNGLYPQSPGAGVQTSAVVLCYGSIGASGTRQALPRYLSTTGAMHIRGGASTPSSWDTCEVQPVSSVA